jgi:glycosyltransferase involved in cell wall biosynthesis
MLRICLVGFVAAGHSGIPRYAASLTRGLDSVAPEFPDLSLRLLTNARGARNAPTRHIPTDLASGPFANARAGPGRLFAEQLGARSAKADLLHFFDLGGPLLAPRRPFVTTIHDAAVSRGFEGALVAHKRLLQPFAVRNAVAAIAVSAFAKDEAVRMLDADPDRTEVVHSGPGLVPAADGAGSAGAMEYLLYVGNLAAHKNLPLLIRAFAALRTDERLLLVGRRGERFEEVRRAVAASPARDRIEIRRDVSDPELDSLYRGARMLVLPSVYEGFGFTALEAMARGCPVLASDIPALREVCGGGAMLLPPGDEAAWTEAMRRLADDDDLREELRRRGEATVRRYSWERTARRVCELFRRVGTPAR